MKTLSTEQRTRYERSILVKDLGEAGQLKLLEARVLVIGTGGLGSPCLAYLVASGVGTVGFADGDWVELSNLQRQILHYTTDIGRAKTESAEEKLGQLNPDVKLCPYDERINQENINNIISNYDLVIDGTDNFPTRFLVNDACVRSRKTLIHAGVLDLRGQLMTIVPGQTACYRCIFGEVPVEGTVPTTGEVGVMPTMAGLMGVLMANEAIKIITGFGAPLYNKLMTFEVASNTLRQIVIAPNPECSVCG